MSKMDLAIKEIKHLAANTDETTRQQLMATLHRLAYSMECPNDTSLRYGHLNLQAAMIKIGVDLGLFRYLAKSPIPLTVEEISLKTGAEKVLLARILRYLAATDAIEEVSEDQYSANNVTNNLAEDLTNASVRHYFPTTGPQFQALPNFLRKIGYQNPTDQSHTAFHEAWNTSQDVYSWFTDHPEHLGPFNNYMAFRGAGQTKNSWQMVYSINEETINWDSERALYVDVGGGIGHQCARFREKYPNLPGRVILQDLPHSIAKALRTPGVENMAHDFFQPQPVKGAKFYYMRSVLHNHPPDKARKLLENTKAAMAPDSVLLIDEIVLPETGVNANVASIDMTALTVFASMERTEAQWKDAVVEVGLELVRTYRYSSENYESVMDVRLPLNDE